MESIYCSTDKIPSPSWASPFRPAPKYRTGVYLKFFLRNYCPTISVMTEKVLQRGWKMKVRKKSLYIKLQRAFIPSVLRRNVRYQSSSCLQTIKIDRLGLTSRTLIFFARKKSRFWGTDETDFLTHGVIKSLASWREVDIIRTYAYTSTISDQVCVRLTRFSQNSI